MLIIVNRMEFKFKNNVFLRIIFNPKLELIQGDVIAIIGPNGAGKTSFLEALAGIKQTSGFIGEIFGKKSLEKLKAKEKMQIGFLPSNPTLFFSQPTVKEEFTYLEKIVPESNIKWFRWEEKWSDYAKKSPFVLSWGEQRLLILDLLFSQDAKIYLLDDFTVSLDHLEKLYVGKEIQRLNEENRTVIVVARDPSVLHYLPKNTQIYWGKTFQDKNWKVTVFKKCLEENQYSIFSDNKRKERKVR